MEENNKLTLREYVEAFKDDLEATLLPKLTQVQAEYDQLAGKVEFRTWVRQGTLRDYWNENSVSFDQREVDLMFVELFTDMELKKKLKGLELEIKNISTALKVLKMIKENRKDPLDVATAKETSIESIFPGKLTQSGKRLMGNCPFHEDHSPSLVVYPDNTFHCFGCQAHGDSIDFEMKLNELSFVEAVKRLS